MRAAVTATLGRRIGLSVAVPAAIVILAFLVLPFPGERLLYSAEAQVQDAQAQKGGVDRQAYAAAVWEKCYKGKYTKEELELADNCEFSTIYGDFGEVLSKYYTTEIVYFIAESAGKAAVLSILLGFMSWVLIDYCLPFFQRYWRWLLGAR